jgi:hypothetical protein
MSIEELEDTKGVYKSESINRRRTDNTMAKRRRTDNTMAKRRRTDNTMAKRRRTDNTMAKRKRTNNDRQNIHIQLIPQNECKTIYWDLQQLLLSTVL